MNPQDSSWIIPLISLALGGLAGWGASALKIGRYAQMVDDLKDDTHEIRTKHESLAKEVTICQTRIEERTKSYASTLTQAKSPLSLTPPGESLLKRSGADAFVLKYKDELVQKIRDYKPPTAYDVQVYARQVVESLKDDERFKSFKDFVYKEGLDLEPIFIVMSIYLRDVALAVLGFKPEDVDKHDPSKK